MDKEVDKEHPAVNRRIHIDQIGFVVGGTAGEVIVDPDFAQHLATKVFLDTLVDRLSMGSVLIERLFSNVISEVGFIYRPVLIDKLFQCQS